jgi:hypothetical protein
VVVVDMYIPLSSGCHMKTDGQLHSGLALLSRKQMICQIASVNGAWYKLHIL